MVVEGRGMFACCLQKKTYSTYFPQRVKEKLFSVITNKDEVHCLLCKTKLGMHIDIESLLYTKKAVKSKSPCWYFLPPSS